MFAARKISGTQTTTFSPKTVKVSHPQLSVRFHQIYNTNFLLYIRMYS